MNTQTDGTAIGSNFWVQYLAQGQFNMQLDRGIDPLIGGRHALPPELQPFLNLKGYLSLHKLQGSIYYVHIMILLYSQCIVILRQFNHG